MKASLKVSSLYKPRQHRTNSLAFAKNDCHTCAALKKRCDRQRPRCGTCVSSKRKCSGFAMDLVWKDMAVSRGDITQATAAPRAVVDDMDLKAVGERQTHIFKFIQGRPKRRRKTRQGRQALPKSSSPSTATTCYGDRYDCTTVVQNTDSDILRAIPSPSQKDSDSDDEYGSHWNNGVLDPSSATSERRFRETNPVAALPSKIDPCDNGNSLLHIGRKSKTDEKLGERKYYEYLADGELNSIHAIYYQSLAHKYGGILKIYNEEFCIVPLTGDCFTNPFRVEENLVRRNAFLLHAVLALSAHHLAKINNCKELRIEMYRHRSAALQHFTNALSQPMQSALLDTLLLLMNLEVNQSAYGTWGIHLVGARKLLEDSRIVQQSLHNLRVRAILAMLIWWDTTIAFMSRTEPRIPLSFLEGLTFSQECDGWSFYHLSGCPFEFVLAMARLSRLACIYKQTVDMEWTALHMSSLDTIINDVKNYFNDISAEWYQLDHLGDDVNSRRNRYYCIEAWRNAILLYASRVFTQIMDEKCLQVIDQISRDIFDCVQCIPRSDVIQKQLLLPVFLAAAEIGDEETRSTVRQYCAYWGEVFRVYQFDTAADVLEDIWKDWNPSTRDVYWWGIKVGSMKWPGSSCGQLLVSELLLG